MGSVHRVRMESLCVVVGENAGVLVASARLSWAANRPPATRTAQSSCAATVTSFDSSCIGPAGPIPIATSTQTDPQLDGTGISCHDLGARITRSAVTPPAPRDPVARETETLLAEAAFVRRLAGALLRDQSLADDVSQEVLTTALQQPQPPRNWRHWLGAVTRRLAFKTRRANQLRARHESNAAGDPAGDPERDALQRLQMHRELTEAVLLLAEPYRSAVTMRFLEGLPPRVIAQRTNTTSELTRQRVRRGLVMLRERLDRQHGSRHAWCSALTALGFGIGSLPVLTLSILAMNKLATAAGLAIAGTVFALSTDWGSKPITLPSEVAAAETPSLGQTAQTVVAASNLNRTPAPVASPTCRVHVRNVLGFPVADATVYCWDADGAFLQAQTDEVGNVQFTASDAGGLLAIAAQRTPAIRTLAQRTGEHELILTDGDSVAGLMLIDGQPAPANLKLKLGRQAIYALPNVPDDVKAEVTAAQPKHIVTNSQGGFRLAGLPPGWTGSIELPRHLWLLPESGGTRERHSTFPLEQGRRDHLVHTTQLPTIVGTVVWDDDGTPVTGALVNTSTWFVDGTTSPGIGTRCDGNRFVIGVKNDQPNDYLAWCQPARRPAVKKFQARVTAEGCEGEVEVNIGRTEFERGTMVVRLKRVPIHHFLVVDLAGVAIANARILGSTELSEPTDATGRGTFRGHLRNVLEVGAAGYRIGKTHKTSGNGSPDEPWLFRLLPSNRVTVHLLDPDGKQPVVDHVELRATSLPFAGARWGSRLDDVLHESTATRQMSLGRINSGSIRYAAHLSWPKHKTSIVVHSLEPGCKLQIVALDALFNEIAVEPFVAPEFGQETEVHVHIANQPRSLSGIVYDARHQAVIGATIEVTQLNAEGERQVWPSGTAAFKRTTSDTQGKFAVAPLCVDARYKVIVKADGHTPWNQVISASELASERRFVLQDANRVAVQVQDRQGVAVPLRVQAKLEQCDSHMLDDSTTQFENLPSGSVTFLVKIGNSEFRVQHDTSQPTATLRVDRPARLAIAMANGPWPEPAERSALMAIVTRLDEQEEPLSIYRPEREITTPMYLLPGRYRVELEMRSMGSVTPLGLTAVVTLKAGELITAKLQ
mgnify:FL=1